MTGSPPTTAAPGSSGGLAPTTPPRRAPAPASNATAGTTDPPAAGATAGTRRSSITVAGRTVGLRAVEPGVDGVPAAAGLWPRSGRPVVRLSSGSLLASAAPGSAFIPTGADGSVSRFAAGAPISLTAARLGSGISAAPAGTLVLLAPAGGGRWTVLRGTPTG